MTREPFEQFIEPFREAYVNHLGRSVAAAKATHPDLVTELALRVNGEAWDERLLLVRIDMVWQDNGETRLANAELDAHGEVADSEMAFSIGSVSVTTENFFWHGCQLLVSPSPISWVPIWEWFDRWFDQEDANEANGDGFTQVIHSLSQVEQGINACFVVDFGTAPVESVRELLIACGLAGVTNVKLH